MSPSSFVVLLVSIAGSPSVVRAGPNPKNCHARESARGCRLLSPSAAPSSAYNDCFGSGSSVGAGEKALMSELAAGDLVLSSPFEATCVIVNQHKAVSHSLAEGGTRRDRLRRRCPAPRAGAPPASGLREVGVER